MTVEAARSETEIIARGVGGAFVGLLLAMPVHVVGITCGMLVAAFGGLGTRGPWPERAQTLFAVSFGAWQWLYLAPLVLWMRKRWPYAAFGLALAGGLGSLLSAMLGLSLLDWS